MGYCSVLIFFITGYYLLKIEILKIKYIYYAISVYFIFGLAQYLIKKDFAESLIGNFRGFQTNRGMYSLTPEPSFYSNQIILFLILFFVLNTKEKINRKYQLLIYSSIFFQIFLFSKSITGIVYLSVVIILLIIIHKKLFYLIFSVPLFFISVPIYCHFYKTSRLYALLYQDYKNINYSVIKDESANQRITDIAISLYSFLEKFPFALGNGTNSWKIYLNENYIDFKFVLYPALWSNKIMSTYGTVLFETGIIGFIILIIPYSYIALRFKSRNMLALALFIPLFFISAIQLTNPLFGFILGIMFYIVNKNKTESQNEILKEQRI